MAMNTSRRIGFRLAMAFVVLGSASLFGACTVDTTESEEPALDGEENIASIEQTLGAGWTYYTSEEYPPIGCGGDTLISAVQCSGKYCDNIRAYCQPAGAVQADNIWPYYISEESPSNTSVAPAGYWITGMACQGSYCDNIASQWTYVPNLYATNCTWTPWVSEENGGTLWFGSGYYARGVQCSGSYCDNKRFYVCQAVPTTGCSQNTCGTYGDGCWCDSQCHYYGDCCPNTCMDCGNCG